MNPSTLTLNSSIRCIFIYRTVCVCQQPLTHNTHTTQHNTTNVKINFPINCTIQWASLTFYCEWYQFFDWKLHQIRLSESHNKQPIRFGQFIFISKCFRISIVSLSSLALTLLSSVLSSWLLVLMLLPLLLLLPIVQLSPNMCYHFTTFAHINTERSPCWYVAILPAIHFNRHTSCSFHPHSQSWYFMNTSPTNFV